MRGGLRIGLGVVALGLGALRASDAAEPACGPSVSLEGEPALARAVAAGLQGRGVLAGALPGCPAVRARLEHRGGKVRVVLVGDGATRERLVSTTEAAAVFLESWVRPDLSDPLLRTHTLIVSAPARAAVPPTPAVPAAPRVAGALPQLSLAAHGEAAVGTDGAAWIGASLRACAMLGPVCAGVLARFAGGLPAATFGSVSFTRMGGEILVSVAAPFTVGRVVLIPGVAVGGGVLYLATQAGAETIHEDDGGLRAELSLSAELPLRAGVGLDFALALGAAYPPGGDGTFYVPRRMGDDVYRAPVPAPTGPWGLLRAGVGLRWSLAVIALLSMALAIFISGKLLPLRRADAPGGPLSDESLVAACGLGDHAALGLLFDRHATVVYRFVSRLIGAGRTDLDDLVQATFLEVLRSAGKFQRRAAVQTWILGIAANLARHHVRGEGRRRAAMQSFAAAPAEGRARPDEDAAQRQLLARLGDALQELSPEQRAAFVLCDLEEIPGVEVARTLGVPEGTLWRRLHEARRRLRGALGGEGP